MPNPRQATRILNHQIASVCFPLSSLLFPLGTVSAEEKVHEQSEVHAIHHQCSIMADIICTTQPNTADCESDLGKHLKHLQARDHHSKGTGPRDPKRGSSVVGVHHRVDVVVPEASGDQVGVPGESREEHECVDREVMVPVQEIDRPVSSESDQLDQGQANRSLTCRAWPRKLNHQAQTFLIR